VLLAAAADAIAAGRQWLPQLETTSASPASGCKHTKLRDLLACIAGVTTSSSN